MLIGTKYVYSIKRSDTSVSNIVTYQILEKLKSSFVSLLRMNNIIVYDLKLWTVEEVY